MDNPFRHQSTQPPNNRRLWHLLFVAALGLSVLWLSWTLLLDDESEENLFQIEQGKSFVDDEDSLEDTKVLSQETRLRTRKEEIGDVTDTKKKSKVGTFQPPTEHEDEEDDEDEHVGEEDMDDDTKMNEEGLDGGRQRTKKKPSTPPPTKPSDKLRTASQKEVVVHEEDEELTPEELKRLAEEDHDEDAEEDDDEEASAEAVSSGEKGQSSKKLDEKKSSASSEEQKSKTKVETQKKPMSAIDSEKEEEVHDDDDLIELEGDDEDEDEGTGAPPDDTTAEGIEKDVGSKSDEKSLPMGQKTTSVEKKKTPAEIIKDMEEDEEGEPYKEGEDDDTKEEDEDVPLPSGKPPTSKSQVKTPEKGTKNFADENLAPKPAHKAEDEADEDQEDDMPPVPEDEEDAQSIDESEDNDAAPQSTRSGKSSSTNDVEEEKEDDFLLEPNEDEEEEDDDESFSPPVPRSSDKKKPVEPADEADTVDEDDQNKGSVPAQSGKRSVEQKKLAEKAPVVEDEDDEDDEDHEAPSAPEDDEEDESNEEPLASKPKVPARPSQKEEPATEKKAATQAKVQEAEPKSQSALADQEEDDDDAMDAEDVETDEDDKQPQDTPVTKVAPPKVIPNNLDTTSTGKVVSDEVNKTAVNESSVVKKVVFSCESIRKRSDCDVREDCRWKYPKSETTGFFCASQESCSDPSIKHKSKCLSLPKCDWVRISSSTYGCRDKTAGATTNNNDEAQEEQGSEVTKPIVAEKSEVDDESAQSHESETTVSGECDVETKKAKCLSRVGCSWTRVSSQPTKYGCRKQGEEQTKSVAGEVDEGQTKSVAGEVDEEQEGEGYAPADDNKLDNDDDDKEAPVPEMPVASTSNVTPEKKPVESSQSSSVTTTTTTAVTGAKTTVGEESKPAGQFVSPDEQEELSEVSDDVEAEENPTDSPGVPQEKPPCNTVRMKSLCQLRTDCYWKYPVSYSSGKYCTERILSISVAPEKAQLYESVVTGKVPFADSEKILSYSSASAIAANPKFKQHGSDWKRHKSDVSCVLHPECMNKDNVSTELFPKYQGGFAVPPTYIRAQCCTQHPQLRGLFMQVVEFLNREGIPWWVAGQELSNQLFTDGFLLPWTTQITIEFAVFGSKTAADWGATHELRSNLTSYPTTKTRIMRSTKNEFASKILQFNADPQHLPNTIRVCAAKYILGGSKKSSATSSYSPDWLKSERSGKEECYVVSKSSKIPSSKTPIYFVASHVDELDDKGPSVKLIPRILRTASSDQCVQAWRPGTDFEPIPVSAIFPTVPCLGQGKFQGFTGITRCPKDTMTYFAWESKSAGPQFVSKEIAQDLSEFKKWAAIDYCQRGLNKGS